MFFYVNKMGKNQPIAIISDLDLILYNLRKLGFNKENILKDLAPSTKNPTIMEYIGEFIYIVNFNRDFSKADMCFIDCKKIDVKIIDKVLGNLGPRSIEQFKQYKSIIDNTNPDKLEPVSLILAPSAN